MYPASKPEKIILLCSSIHHHGYFPDILIDMDGLVVVIIDLPVKEVSVPYTVTHSSLLYQTWYVMTENFKTTLIEDPF